jgi:nitrogenase molybdenum-iron protein alpha/beta subunit
MALSGSARRGLNISEGRLGVAGRFITETVVSLRPLATSKDTDTAASSNPEAMTARKKRSIRENVTGAGLVPPSGRDLDDAGISIDPVEAAMRILMGGIGCSRLDWHKRERSGGLIFPCCLPRAVGLL